MRTEVRDLVAVVAAEELYLGAFLARTWRENWEDFRRARMFTKRIV